MDTEYRPYDVRAHDVVSLSQDAFGSSCCSVMMYQQHAFAPALVPLSFRKALTYKLPAKRPPCVRLQSA